MQDYLEGPELEVYLALKDLKRANRAVSVAMDKLARQEDKLYVHGWAEDGFEIISQSDSWFVKHYLSPEQEQELFEEKMAIAKAHSDERMAKAKADRAYLLDAKN